MRPAALVLGTGILLIVGCSDTAPRVTPDFMAAAQARDPTVSTTRLLHGREVYVQSCADCHALPDPKATAADAWPRLTTMMGRKSHLSSTEQQDVLHYLLAAQSQPH